MFARLWLDYLHGFLEEMCGIPVCAWNYTDRFHHSETQAVFDFHSSYLFFYFTVGPRRCVSMLSYHILSQWWAEEAAAQSHSFQAAAESR